MSDQGWIGFDLDGTLAKYEGWQGPEHIGEPIKAVQHRALDLLNAGHDVRIFTARVSVDPTGSVRQAIEAWCVEHLGRVLPVTCCKDYGMIELYDDRCVQIISNTGKRADGLST